VAAIAPTFELIDDRFANHQKTAATTLIADNAWNAGIVHAPWCEFDPAKGIGEVEGVLTVDGAERGRGQPDDPFGALAWVAMLAVRRGRPLRSGMVVITGSLIPTFSLDGVSEVVFSLGPWGATTLHVQGEEGSAHVPAH
jgi:2-keto-4-pentenoate hydratase